MKYTKIFSLFVLLLAFGFAGCKAAEEDPKSGSAAKAKQDHARQQGKQVAQAAMNGDQEAVQQALEQEQVWPPPVKDEDNLQVADDLLTRNYVILLDSSGSMNESECSGDTNKAEAAKTALRHFVGNIPAEDNVGLIIFPAGVQEELATNNRESLMNKVDNMSPRDGTPLTWAVQEGYKMLTAQAQRQLGYGEYTLVILTDGRAQNERTLAMEIEAIVGTPKIAINLYTIGFCISGQHTLRTEGVDYNEAHNPEDLTAALAGVLAEAPDFSVIDFEQ